MKDILDAAMVGMRSALSKMIHQKLYIVAVVTVAT